jgi:amino acid transporter
MESTSTSPPESPQAVGPDSQLPQPGRSRTIVARVRRFLFGPPKDVKDPEAFHKISLIAMLAWVGLGADGLSSSAYGPDEAFRTLIGNNHDYSSLAVGLAFGTAFTVFIISYAYSRIIEHFPSGGGGYVVATKLVGPRFGVISGSALLVDYVLTITTSVASGGDAIFSMIPRSFFGSDAVKLIESNLGIGTWLDPVQRWKVLVEISVIAILTILNIRGVKESVTAIFPVFMTFVVTHAILMLVTIGSNAGEFSTVAQNTATNYRQTVAELGSFGTLLLFVRAYSLGGGTYTGIEAVSNGVSIMREPKVRTAKRTMVLMASSLAITAGGIILCYLLAHVTPVDGKTMNAALLEKVFGRWQVVDLPVGSWFVLIALVSEAGLLFIAAQAGFVDGPRVMANMAVDSWLPHRFAALSEHLSMRNGVLLMSFASIAALLYTHGDVAELVVMYSINVFLTFSLSEFGMCRFWIMHRKQHPDWKRHLPIHATGLTLCLTILIVTCMEKFGQGGWLTLVVTGILVVTCFYIKSHYARVVKAIRRLDVDLPDPLKDPTKHGLAEGDPEKLGAIDSTQPVVILFVGGYGGLGRHALLTLLRMFPGHFKGVVFCSIAIIDSGNFKGVEEVEELEKRTEKELDKYVRFAATLGLPAEHIYRVGLEVAVEAERIGIQYMRRYPRGVVVAGQLILTPDSMANRVLHNETAFLIQRRLQHAGVPMIVLPVRLDLQPHDRQKRIASRAEAPQV